MKLYVIAGRGGGVQETSIRPFGQWELLSIHNISSVASEPERAAEARSAVVASSVKDGEILGICTLARRLVVRLVQYCLNHKINFIHGE